MRALLTTAVAVGVGLLWTGAARAGLYNTAEPPLYPPLRYEDFKTLFDSLRSIAVEVPGKRNPLREHYLSQAAALRARERSGGLTLEDRINLGAYEVRLLRFEDAARVLESALAQDPDNFMVLSNLATANYLAGRADRAVFYQQRALKVWPSVSLFYTAEQLRWYRRFERYQLTLLELRQQEARVQSGRAPETPDDLFHVRFIGPSGQYEAGDIAPDQRDRLPVEDVPIVTQLLLWMPFDNRLYWLLAELLNAQGDIVNAAAILDELVYARAFTGAPELRAHRQVLLKAKPAAKLLTGDQGATVRAQLAWMLRPRGATLTPGAGPLIDDAAWAGALINARRSSELSEPAGPRPGPETAGAGTTAAVPSGRPPDASWMPDWKTFLVGLASGVAVTLLLGMQVLQNRKGAKARVG
jgi:hypothetical protein